MNVTCIEGDDGDLVMRFFDGERRIDNYYFHENIRNYCVPQNMRAVLIDPSFEFLLTAVKIAN